jgi:hypothetical protein
MISPKQSLPVRPPGWSMPVGHADRMRPDEQSEEGLEGS